MLLTRLLTSRFRVSLGVALFLCTLASADSINGKTGVLPSGASAYGGDNTYTGHFSTNGGRATPTTLVAYSGSLSTSENGNARIGNPLSGAATFSNGVKGYIATDATFLQDRHGTIAYKNGSWAVWRTGTSAPTGMSTPEPGSLMLLSTGLMGIAGMVRRKLLRG